MNEIEVSAKKMEDAINEGLRELDTTIDNVTIEILSQGGFLKKAKIKMRKILPESEKKSENTEATAKLQNSSEKKAMQDKPATVADVKTNTEVKKDERKPQPRNEKQQSEIVKSEKKDNREKQKPELKSDKNSEQKSQPKPEPEQKSEPKPEQKSGVIAETKEQKLEKKVPPEAKAQAETFLKGLFERMGLEVGIEIEADTELNINLVCDEMKLIGYKGTTLEALTYLVSATINKGKNYIIVNIDNNNYHKDRENKLVEIARRKADKCIETGKRVILDPMNNRERKIIHSTLSNDERIVTKSKGQEPYRRVIIYPKNDKIE